MWDSNCSRMKLRPSQRSAVEVDAAMIASRTAAARLDGSASRPHMPLPLAGDRSGRCGGRFARTSPADDGGLDLRQLPLQVLRVAMEHLLADDHRKDRVTQKLQTLVAVQTVLTHEACVKADQSRSRLVNS